MVFSDNSTLNKFNWTFNAGRFSIVRNKVSWEFYVDLEIEFK